jgi:uncharacterized glyoxalase superfamily protein PhnB
MARPGIDFISLAVADVRRTLAFYRDGLGWPGVTAGEDHVKIELERGLSLVFYERGAFEKQYGHLVAASRAGGTVLSQFVTEDVAALLDRAQAAGGTALGPPQDYEWGSRVGYFHDPDGHAWEVIGGDDAA